jgi:hypothetical protein
MVTQSHRATERKEEEVLCGFLCGRQRLGEEVASWNRLAGAIGLALRTGEAGG